MDILLINPYSTPSEKIKAFSTSNRVNPDGAVPVANQRKIYSEVNLGLLSLASALADHGFSTAILDLTQAGEPWATLQANLSQWKPKTVGISCQYHSHYLPLQELACRIHQNFPEIRLIVGGVHAGSVPRKVLADIPFLDAVCAGEGEDVIISMLKMPPENWHTLTGVYTHNGGQGIAVAANINRPHRYSLYPQWREQVFILEESRGCPYDCRFCAHIRVHRERPLAMLREELIQYLSATSVENPEIVLASDTCGLSRERFQGILDLLVEAQSLRRFRWGTQTRVDAAGFHLPGIGPRIIQSGLASMSLGLESASETVLQLMHKTKRLAEYLSCASRLMQALGRLEDLCLRVNVLLYVGENKRTIQETRDFLSQHRSFFSGVHTSVIHAYPNTELWQELDWFSECFGTSRVRSQYWDSVAAYPLNPSAQMDFQQAHQIAAGMRADFNSEEYKCRGS